MVDRCEINGRTPCTVVDLDGTYVDGNTLKIYLGCGLRYLMAKRKISAVIRVLSAVVRRKLKLCDHRQMKEVILSELYPYADLLEDFSRRVVGHINPDVKNLIARNAHQGHRILMATAAPEFYVRSFWSGDLVATDFRPEEPMIECSVMEKVSRVNQWFKDNDCRIDTVVTDSVDDAGLFVMNANGTNVLVKPSKSVLRTFRELKPAHFLLIEEL